MAHKAAGESVRHDDRISRRSRQPASSSVDKPNAAGGLLFAVLPDGGIRPFNRRLAGGTMNMLEDIARVARDFYIMSGLQDGHELENWLKAEALVKTWYEPFEEREMHVGATVPPKEIQHEAEETTLKH